MAVAPSASEGQRGALRVLPYGGDLGAFLGDTPRLAYLESERPCQVAYLSTYLTELGCQSVVEEPRYIDRDYVDDVALYYSRSLRTYPNYCKRLHFFCEPLSDEEFRSRICAAAGDRQAIESALTRTYLGFVVVRPLPAHPIGRTVLSVHATSDPEFKRLFPCTRAYVVHLAGLSLEIAGLAFQQQDQGVSACAMTAIWSASHRIAPQEDLRVPTAAEINQSASRYIMTSGRTLPSDGLGLHQVCEAIRAIGLAPAMIAPSGLKNDRRQILTYVRSGFPAVLALRNPGRTEGHAVCCVGAKLRNADLADTLSFKDIASSLDAIYIHDDRLGPYAAAQLFEKEHDGQLLTALRIKWPDHCQAPPEEFLLSAMIVPVPVKVRMSGARLREGGMWIAEFVARSGDEFKGKVVLDTWFEKATDYRTRAFGFGLSDEGLCTLQSAVKLSRYVGLIELSANGTPCVDVLVDVTEIKPNMAILAMIARRSLPGDLVVSLRGVAEGFSAAFLQ